MSWAGQGQVQNEKRYMYLPARVQNRRWRVSHSVTQGLTREVHDGGGEGAGVQKSKRQLAAHRGPHVGVREGEFDPVWSRPPVPTLEAAVSGVRDPPSAGIAWSPVSDTKSEQPSCSHTHAAAVFVAFPARAAVSVV